MLSRISSLNWCRVFACAGMIVLFSVMVGCQRETVKDYGRPLPPGHPALRKITNPAELPDLRLAYQSVEPSLGPALERSLAWFDKPSTQSHFPVRTIDGQITHEAARASVYAFMRLLQSSTSAHQFIQSVTQEFDIYTSVGWDGSGTVLYTGYYTPTFNASFTRTNEYRFPLYKRPADLVTDPITGEVRGRRVGNLLLPSYPTRAQIEQNNLLEGNELVWLKSRLDAYIIHVNGSARLNMTDGSSIYVGYNGNNGHEYTSIGRLLVDDGKLDPNRLSIPAIRAYFQENPEQLDYYLRQNDRFVFFDQYPGDNWPAGSLGFKVTPMRTLATDKSLFPRACVTLVSTRLTTDGRPQVFEQFMLDQDAGGAIRAPGRADIYMGIGHRAEMLAGRQLEEGRLYYFILKPSRVAYWLRELDAARQVASN